MSTQRGSLPLTAKLCINSGSMAIDARPFTRNVSPTPGIRNRSAMRGSRMMLRNPSIVARTIGNRQRLVVENPHEAGRITFGRAIKSLGARRRNSDKRRCLDQLAVTLIDMVDFLDDRSPHSLPIKRLELIHGRDQMIAVGHCKSPLSGQQLPAVMCLDCKIENNTGF